MRTSLTLKNRAFTITELLVVVAIIVLLTVAILPAVLGGLETRKLSDAARAIHAAFATARDRALATGENRGLRLVRDDDDPWVVTELVYVGVPEPFSVGTVNNTAAARTIVTDSNPDPHWEQIDQATGTRRVPNQQGGTAQAYIRFNHAGRLYGIDSVDSSSSPARLRLLATDPVPPTYPAGTNYQIFLPPSPIAQVKSVAMPAGTVIDVRFADIAFYYGATHPFANDPEINVPRSRGIPSQVPLRTDLVGQDGIYGNADDPKPFQWPAMDILFGPNGSVTGTGAKQTLIHLWVGVRADKKAARERKLLTLNTQTGLVQVYDQPNNSGTAPNYPEIYSPAEQMLGVSVLP